MATEGLARGIDMVKVGDESLPHRVAVTGADVSQFAELTGDHERIHTDEEYARSTPYGRRIAHGVHLLGLMSAKLFNEERVGQPNVSYGYDRIRFIRPIFVGDTITTQAIVVEKRPERNEVVVEERCLNPAGELAVIARHIYKFI